MIGSMCDDTWKMMFPLLPMNHDMRKSIDAIRRLEYMWGVLPAYANASTFHSSTGAWMPLSVAHQNRLLDHVGLFDHKYMVPSNPWCAHDGKGISKVFNQSYHSVYITDCFNAKHFKDWANNRLLYRTPTDCHYPFAEAGGTPTEADFSMHRMKFQSEGHTSQKKRRYQQLVYNRFGNVQPIRVGSHFDDCGILQDMFMDKNRDYANISQEQKMHALKTDPIKEVFLSNFLSYARVHSIIALSSSAFGTESGSDNRIVASLYRTYVDTYKCHGIDPGQESIPAVLGFSVNPIRRKGDRAITFYAGTLPCVNAKLERFCFSDRNRDEKVCFLYKQLHLNSATLLFTRFLREIRHDKEDWDNYKRMLVKHPGLSYEAYKEKLIKILHQYIHFLQTSYLGYLIQNGADLNGISLSMLEPARVQVPLYEEDENMMEADFMSPIAGEVLKRMNLNGKGITRSQMALLALLPPHEQILGTLRFNNAETELYDMQHIKKKLMKDVVKSNKELADDLLSGMMRAAVAKRITASDGGLDLSLDASMFTEDVPERFDAKKLFKNPIQAASHVGDTMVSTISQPSSTLSLAQRNVKMRNKSGPGTALTMSAQSSAEAIERVHKHVTEEARRTGQDRMLVLKALPYPDFVKRMVARKKGYDRDLFNCCALHFFVVGGSGG